MNVSEAMIEIRNKVNDRDEVGLDDEEILSYLNEAIQYASALLISNGNTLLVHDMEMTQEVEPLPSGFVKFAGMFPVCQTGTTMEALEDVPLKLRYFALPPLVEMDDEMPFDYLALNQAIIKVACVHINNQQRLDVTQDKSLSDEINNAIAGSMTQ